MKRPEPPTEAEVARRFRSPDGMIVLVGRDARANDVLTTRIASQRDFWLHVAGTSGSHVVVRNPEGLEALPRDTLRFAAALAAKHSKARNAGRVDVHVALAKDVRKERGSPAGQVVLRRYKSVKAETAAAEGAEELT